MTGTITLRYKMCNVEFGRRGFNVIIYKKIRQSQVFSKWICLTLSRRHSQRPYMHVADVEIPRALETTLIRAFFPKHFSISTPKV